MDNNTIRQCLRCKKWKETYVFDRGVPVRSILVKRKRRQRMQKQTFTPFKTCHGCRQGKVNSKFRRECEDLMWNMRTKYPFLLDYSDAEVLEFINR
jgi:hypothetical protein